MGAKRTFAGTRNRKAATRRKQALAACMQRLGTGPRRSPLQPPSVNNLSTQVRDERLCEPFPEPCCRRSGRIHAFRFENPFNELIRADGSLFGDEVVNVHRSVIHDAPTETEANANFLQQCFVRGLCVHSASVSADAYARNRWPPFGEARPCLWKSNQHHISSPASGRPISTPTEAASVPAGIDGKRGLARVADQHFRGQHHRACRASREDTFSDRAGGRLRRAGMGQQDRLPAEAG